MLGIQIHNPFRQSQRLFVISFLPLIESYVLNLMAILPLLHYSTDISLLAAPLNLLTTCFYSSRWLTAHSFLLFRILRLSKSFVHDSTTIVILSSFSLENSLFLFAFPLDNDLNTFRRDYQDTSPSKFDLLSTNL